MKGAGVPASVGSTPAPLQIRPPIGSEIESLGQREDEVGI